MTISGSITFMFACFLLTAQAFPQEESVYKVTQLNDHIYKLTTDGGGYTVKVIASIGDDGMLLVDTGIEQAAGDLKKTLATIREGAPDIIINTHEHVEHIGGNALWGNDPIIIGHEILKTRLRSGSFLFDEWPDEALPDLTFTDSLTIKFNGEDIRLIALPGGHSDNDIIVWFTGSKIVCVSAISNGKHFPSVDGSSGDVLRYDEIAKRAIDMLPDDVTIIPGHGEDGTMDEFRKFHEMLVKTEEIVKQGLAEGKELQTLQEEDVLKDFKPFEGSYTSASQWIEYLVEGFQKDKERPELIFEPLYYAYKDNGPAAAVEKYYDLKNNHPDEYYIDEACLIVIGMKVYGKKNYPAATEFLNLYVKEYPDGEYTYYGYYLLGEIYKETNRPDKARECFNKSLASKETESVRQALGDLESE